MSLQRKLTKLPSIILDGASKKIMITDKLFHLLKIQKIKTVVQCKHVRVFEKEQKI